MKLKEIFLLLKFRNFKYLFLLFLSLSVHGESTVSYRSFDLYIKPQIVSIGHDFLKVLCLFDQYPCELTKLWERTLNYKTSFHQIAKYNNGNLSIDNKVFFDNHLKIFQEDEAILWNLKKQITHNNLDTSSLEKERYISQAILEIQLLIGTLDAATLGLKAQARKIKTSSFELTTSVDHYFDAIGLLMLTYLPARYQNDFKVTFHSFILPLQVYVLRQNALNTLTKNFPHYNLSWNQLNQRMTKHAKDVPPVMIEYFNSINNRWNQIIKICYGM